jgi:hypothetical protein
MRDAPPRPSENSVVPLKTLSKKSAYVDDIVTAIKKNRQGSEPEKL